MEDIIQNEQAGLAETQKACESELTDTKWRAIRLEAENMKMHCMENLTSVPFFFSPRMKKKKKSQKLYDFLKDKIWAWVSTRKFLLSIPSKDLSHFCNLGTICTDASSPTNHMKLKPILRPAPPKQRSHEDFSSEQKIWAGNSRKHPQRNLKRCSIRKARIAC